MNTWKRKAQPAQAGLTSGPSANLTRERSPAAQHLQEAAAGEQSRPLELDRQMRGRMERQFGLDFSAVRLVESDLPGKLGADAVAQGDLIRFAPGAFRPETAQGEQLLSHELSHVVQQSRGIPGGRAGLPLHDAALERGADVMAARAMSGEPAAGPARAFTPISAAQAPLQGGKTRKRPPRKSAASTRLSRQAEIRNNPNPFRIIQKEMANRYKNKSNHARRTSGYSGRNPGAITAAKLRKNPDNPTGSAYLGAMQQDIDAAQNKAGAERAFRKYTRSQHLRSIVGRAMSDGGAALAHSRLKLKVMKKQLKQLGRVMVDFPGLELGALGQGADGNSRVMAYSFPYSGNVQFQDSYFGEGNIPKKNRKRVNNNRPPAAPYTDIRHAGVHEAGHVIIGHLAKTRLKLKGQKPAGPSEKATLKMSEQIATEIVQNAMLNLAAGSTPAGGKIRIYLAANDTASIQERLSWLEGKKLISRYGSRNVEETVAEAMGDVYTRGEEASELNREIVRLLQERYLQQEAELRRRKEGAVSPPHS